MFLQRLQDNEDRPIRQDAARFLLQRLDRFTCTLRIQLDAQIDRRLVRTFYDLLVTILILAYTPTLKSKKWSGLKYSPILISKRTAIHFMGLQKQPSAVFSCS